MGKLWIADQFPIVQNIVPGPIIFLGKIGSGTIPDQFWTTDLVRTILQFFVLEIDPAQSRPIPAFFRIGPKIDPEIGVDQFSQTVKCYG